MATDPDTDTRILWYIARHVPALRFWLIANPSATPELLEYVSQVGGPHVKESFDVLFSALDTDESDSLKNYSDTVEES
ncbi:hypothetical protein EJ419_04070 [Alloscardovia theropitheci]|uniref:Leucine rich repeat variant domain-containing protein n=1 Tax=Alloscardovia theropitheci TaxID=2496842 RepID=A0A4R0QSI4_9BIFI|nr:hypothetical protein EJ419_04070 [Alloscardovia theropitheci]